MDEILVIVVLFYWGLYSGENRQVGQVGKVGKKKERFVCVVGLECRCEWG